MGIFTHREKGGLIADVIRCDEPDFLIWKWRPKEAASDDGRANAIRFGSRIRVKDGETAVFVYPSDNGIDNEDFIVGPCDQTLEPENLPIISSLLGLAYNGDSPFQAEVYFINTAHVVQQRFAVPFFDVYDYKYQEISVPTAVRGTITYRIEDCREFISLHRMHSFNADEFGSQIRDAVVRYAKNIVANLSIDEQIPVIQIERKIADVNNRLEGDITERLENTFGVQISAVDVEAIELDKTSVGYQNLMAITRDAMVDKIKAQTEADIKTISEMQKVNVENTAETLRIKREEDQYARHMQTESANINAHSIDKQTEVGVHGADALGNMGGMSVNSGSGENGINPVNLMAGLAVGGAVGQNIAGIINNGMAGNAPAQTPPPVPALSYYVAVDGKPQGPFHADALKQMVENGTLTLKSLVWTSGMADWKNAADVADIRALFDTQQTPPPIPNI